MKLSLAIHCSSLKLSGKFLFYIISHPVNVSLRFILNPLQFRYSNLDFLWLRIFFLKLSNSNVMFTPTVKISSFHGLELYYFTFTTFYPFKRETLEKALWTFCFYFFALYRVLQSMNLWFSILFCFFFLRNNVETLNAL